MDRWRDFKDDLLYYSSAWEGFLGAVFALIVMIAGLVQYGVMALLAYGWIILLALIWGVVRLRRGRKFRLSHPECSREERIKAIKDEMLYDQAKKYFIYSGIFFGLLLLDVIESAVSHRWSFATLVMVGYCLLDSFVKGVLSVRYERQQHRDYLREHPETSEKL